MNKKHYNFYINNKEYSDFLCSHNLKDYIKYVYYINKFCKSGKFLDVGCGVGTAINLLNKYNKNISAGGIEISNTSIQLCRSKDIKAKKYNGERIPYKNESFDIVGSFNVLEHTIEPKSFLDEKYRVLKKGGILIIVCPNFLSISNGYHYFNSGFFNKIKNILITLSLPISSNIVFIKMEPTSSKEIRPDYDAINATNPISVINWSNKKQLNLLYWSSQQKFTKNKLVGLLDRTILKTFLGSVFLVFRKI